MISFYEKSRTKNNLFSLLKFYGISKEKLFYLMYNHHKLELSIIDPSMTNLYPPYITYSNLHCVAFMPTIRKGKFICINIADELSMMLDFMLQQVESVFHLSFS